MIKWKLLITTLPFVAVAVAVKLGLRFGLDFRGLIEFGEVGVVLTGGVFLIGFMLAGVMADYKESEKLPAELACQLEAIEETFAQAAASKPALDLGALRGAVLTTTDTIRGWLRRTSPAAQVFRSLEDLAERAHGLERAGATPIGVRALNELSTLRKHTTRIGVISRTGFLSSGYALLESLTVAILALLLLSRFRSPIAEGVVMGFVCLVFVYMIRLIRDIDDPFEYSPDGVRGAAEVDLFPIDEYRERLAARAGATPAGAAPAGAAPAAPKAAAG